MNVVAREEKGQGERKKRSILINLFKKIELNFFIRKKKKMLIFAKL